MLLENFLQPRNLRSVHDGERESGLSGLETIGLLAKRPNLERNHALHR